MTDADRWDAWDRFVESVPETGFMQSSWWAEFRSTAGFEHFGLTLKHHGAIVAGALVQKFSPVPQSCFYYIQDGPVLPNDEPMARDVFEALLEEIDRRRETEQEAVTHLRVELRWRHMPAGLSGFQPAADDHFMEPRRTLLVDLRPSETQILAQMKTKGRYNIRVAERHGVSIVEDTSDRGLADFYRIYDEMAARQDIESKPEHYFEGLLAALSSAHKGSMFFAEYRGERIATAIVVYFGQRATYFYGASLDCHRNVMAPYLLHFDIMRRAKAKGYDWYDLWGIAPCDDPNHRWTNITIFKQKFGGAEINLVPSLDYVYDGAAYERYVATESCRQRSVYAESQAV